MSLYQFFYFAFATGYSGYSLMFANMKMFESTNIFFMLSKALPQAHLDLIP